MESNSVNVQNSNLWSSINSFKVKVSLENSSKVIVLLDISAKINIMIREQIKNTGLAIWHNSKLELVSYTCHNRLFLSLCKDIEDVIGGL